MKEAVEAGADIIMLDNMTPEVMKQAVELINAEHRRMTLVISQKKIFRRSVKSVLILFPAEL